MLSDVSDLTSLTDLSSDEDDNTPKPKSVAKSREYHIKPSLRPPRTSQYTTKALYDHIIENTIDLDPEYQRDVVWPESKQTGLIDSLVHNYYIPPIVFAVKVSSDGSERRTCIDGKQRLTSIQRYMDGLIPHKDSFTNHKLWYKSHGSSRKLLPLKYRKMFANKQIVCVEYDALSEDQEREIFQRVQLGVALTPAERMQAISGPWPSLVRDVLHQVLGEDGFDDYLEWGRGRGRDFQCMTSIAYIMEKYPKHTNPSVAQLEKWLEDDRPVPAKFRDSLFDTFRIFVCLARDQTLRKCFQTPTRVSPVEFVMIGLLINVYCMQLSPTQLSSAIAKLRANVRANFKDIRMNATITRHMFNFVTKKIKVSDLQSDGKGDIPATVNRQSAPRPTKRKRTTAGSDDESERPVGPTKIKTTAVKSVKASSSQSNSKVATPVAKPVVKPPRLPKPTPTSSSSKPIPRPASPSSPSSLSSSSSSSSSSPPPRPSIPAPLPPPTIPAHPQAPPVPSIPAPVPPIPPTPAPAPNNMSLPLVQALPTHPPPMVLIKHEARESPPLPAADQLTATQAARSFPMSSVPDRLAPIRAAKALTLDTSATTISPPLDSGMLAPTPGVEIQPSPHTNHQPPAPGSTTIPAGLRLTQAKLNALLAKAGYQPQQRLPSTSPANNPSPSDVSITPPQQTAQPTAQIRVHMGNPDTLPAKPSPTGPPPEPRKVSGGAAASSGHVSPSQGEPPAILLATPMAVNAPAHPPFQRPAAAAAASAAEHSHGSQPPPPPSATSSRAPYSPTTPTYRGGRGCRAWSRGYDARDTRDRRDRDGPGTRGSYGARGRYRGSDKGYRGGSRRDWERRDHGWGRGRSPPGGHYKREPMD